MQHHILAKSHTVHKSSLDKSGASQFPLSTHCLNISNLLVTETLDIERLLRDRVFATAEVILRHATCAIIVI